MAILTMLHANNENHDPGANQVMILWIRFVSFQINWQKKSRNTQTTKKI
jgi:hypothetical protein